MRTLERAAQVHEKQTPREAVQTSMAGADPREAARTGMSGAGRKPGQRLRSRAGCGGSSGKQGKVLAWMSQLSIPRLRQNWQGRRLPCDIA